VDHFRVLKRALQITWKYRALWLVGLLLVLAGGGVGQGVAGPGGATGAPQASGDGEAWRDFPEGLPRHEFEDLDHFWEVAAPFIVLAGIIILAVVLVSVVLGVVKVIVRYVTRTSLVVMVDEYEETGTEIGVWDGLRRGWSGSAVRLFLISLMLKLPLALLVLGAIGTLVTLAVLSFINASGPAIASGILLLLLLIPVGLLAAGLGAVLGPVIEVAYRVCVLEERGAWDAIKGALGLIRRNLGATALQWLLLIGLGIAWRIALVPVNLVLVFIGLLAGGLPALVLGGLLAAAAGWPAGLVAGLVVFIPLFVLLLLLPNTALTTAATIFHSTTWTLTYRELKVLDDGKEDSEVIEAKAA
jgi:hypothetical protein